MKKIVRSDAMRSDDFLVGLTAVKAAQQDLLRTSFAKYSHDLISLFSKDICESPWELRVRFLSLSNAFSGKPKIQ